MGLYSSESSKADVTEITDTINELDSETEPLQRQDQAEILEPADTVELCYRQIQMPMLKYPAAVPNVKWQQSNSIILLLIEAPDVRDYYLNVTVRCLQYRWEYYLFEITSITYRSSCSAA